MQGNQQHIPPPRPPQTVTQPSNVPTSTSMDPNGPRAPAILHYIIRPPNNMQGMSTIVPIGSPGQAPLRLASVGGAQALLQSSLAVQRHPGLQINQRATFLSQPTLIRGIPGQPGLGIHHGPLPAGQTLGFQTSSPITSQYVTLPHPSNFNATAPSNLAPDAILQKGVSILNAIVNRAPDKKPTTLNLITQLVEGKKTAEEFAIALREVGFSSIESIVPFLNLFLPQVRHAIATNKPVPGLDCLLPHYAPIDVKPNISHLNETTVNPQVSYLTATPSSPALVPQLPVQLQSNESSTPASTTQFKKKKPSTVIAQKSATAMKREAREAKKKAKEESAKIKAENAEAAAKAKTEKSEKAARQKTIKKRSDKPRRQEKIQPLSTTMRDEDDDVYDVATMGGVNLAEENQRIMAAGTEMVGTQIRSCKDEMFLDMKSLTSRISRITSKYELGEPSAEVVTMISHATQERLKDIVERLGIMAIQRCENLKLDSDYEVSHDVRGQIKFLAELDRIDKRRTEEQERENLLKIAKSRSKVEDPEQIKLRQKAKDMQRAEQEEERQREANATALLAIGPRKKLKIGDEQPNLMNQQNNPREASGDKIRRIKRVNMKDLQALFELDGTDLNQLIKIAARSK